MSPIIRKYSYTMFLIRILNYVTFFVNNDDLQSSCFDWSCLFRYVVFILSICRYRYFLKSLILNVPTYEYESYPLHKFIYTFVDNFICMPVSTNHIYYIYKLFHVLFISQILFSLMFCFLFVMFLGFRIHRDT